MADQRFGNRGVYSIHRHVITVIGRPAKCQFRKISGTDDKAAGLIRHIHQKLGALPRLRVFKNNIEFVRIMPDVLKMLFYRRRNIDDAQCCADSLGQIFGVSLCPGSRTKARHGQMRQYPMRDVPAMPSPAHRPAEPRLNPVRPKVRAQRFLRGCVPSVFAGRWLGSKESLHSGRRAPVHRGGQKASQEPCGSALFQPG